MMEPLILFVPGKDPKPPPDVHRLRLWRALTEGVRRSGDDPGPRFSCDVEFQVCAWNVVFYAQCRDAGSDVDDIERAMRNREPTARDIAEAKDWHRRRDRMFYDVADRLPWLIPWLPNETLQATIADTQRYFSNYRDIAREVREELKRPLRSALADGRPVMVIGHSMGSVIAFDTLWELTWEERLSGKVDFLTLGSPLGMRFVQRRLLGKGLRGERRYPRLIRQWDNVAAVGDLAALDETVGDDYRYMVRHKLADSIVDHVGGVFNHYREGERLNVHRSYGYLLNPITGGIIVRWWRRSPLSVSRAGAAGGQWAMQPL